MKAQGGTTSVGFEFYISPADISIAATNGISEHTLEQRVRMLAWHKERAITVPPRQKQSVKEWRELAEQNGIKYPTLRKRINTLGWDPLRAATEHLQDRQAAMRKVGEGGRIYSLEHIATAASNGISYDRFCQRQYRGWKLEDAMTIPIMTGEQIRRIYKDRYGRATRKLRPAYVKGVTA